MKFRRMIKPYAKVGMSPVQTILGMVVMARAGDEFVELQVAPPAILLHFAGGASLSIDKSLRVTWFGKATASRPQIDAIVERTRDEMHRDGRILPYPKLLDILGEARQLVTASEMVEHHKALLATPSVRPNSWGFLERRLARLAQG